MRLHDLRHSYASYLASAGLSLPVIGALLGHSSPATTQRYAHLLDSPLRDATERVGAIVTGAGNVPAPVVPLRRTGALTPSAPWDRPPALEQKLAVLEALWREKQNPIYVWRAIGFCLLAPQ